MLERCRQFISNSLRVEVLIILKMARVYFLQVFLSLSLFLISFSVFSQSETIESIYFTSNSFSIDKKYEMVLNHIAKQLASDTFGYLKIFAFADTKGSENYNDMLSEKRADAIYNYLVSRARFDTTRVYVTSLGESSDIYDLHFPAAHKQERCVDI